MARPVHAPLDAAGVGAILTADAPVASIGVLAVALAFHVAGSALLAFGAPPLAALHAFAGFIVLAVVATSHQLLPVLLRVPPTPWAQTVIPAAGFACGFALLVFSFMGGGEFAAAGTLLALSSALWCTFTGSRVLRAAGERATAAAMGAAFLAFLVAAFFGVWMAYDLAGGAAPSQAVADVHGTLMVAVFASMLIVALSYRFVPMFALAHANAYGKRWMQWMFLAGGAVMAANFASIGAGLSLVSLGALAYQHGRTLQARLRKRLDASLIYAMAAWAFAIASAGLVCVRGLTPASVVPALALAVLGWLSITIFGYGLKICGFLSWQVAKQRAPESALAPLASAIPLPAAYASLATLSLGTLLIAFGGAGASIAGQAGCAVYLAGALAYIATFASVAYPYLLCRSERHA